MFKKKLKQEIIELKKELESVKKENMFLKHRIQSTEETEPLINISDVYIFKIDGIYKIVKLVIKDIIGNSLFEKNISGYESKLIDIFSGLTIYSKTSKIILSPKYFEDCKNYKLIPIYKVESALLAYTNNLVPIYILKRLYYSLNQVDLSSPILNPKSKIKAK